MQTASSAPRPPALSPIPPLRADWRYHFAGIGGVGMSALAELLHRRGFQVSGSDQLDSESLRRLAALGIAVRVGHDPAELEGADALVYTSAVREGHALRRAALVRGLPAYHRAALLAALSADTRLVTVTGTHGKSTSAGAAAQVWRACGLDPTALVGGDVLEWERRNLLAGGRHWMVAEADESDGSFVLLRPEAILLTNAEPDHLDHHGSTERLLGSFREFLARLPAGGVLVYGTDDPSSRKLGQDHRGRKISFGLADADVEVRVVAMQPGAMRVALRHAGRETELTARLGGRHNAVNLAGVYALARAFDLPEPGICRALGSYRGVARRQEFIGRARGFSIFDDYAHHPTEIRATLTMFQALYGAPVSVVFQPHLYSRTAHFAREFAEALRPAARIWVTDVYAAREEPMPGVSGRTIVKHLDGHRSAAFVEHWREIPDLLERDPAPGGILLTLGAGDITELGPLLLARSGA